MNKTYLGDSVYAEWKDMIGEVVYSVNAKLSVSVSSAVGGSNNI